MIILMNEHFLSRMDLNRFGTSFGDDEFIIPREDNEKLFQVIYRYVSKNYKNKIDISIKTNYQLEKFLISLINKIDINFCELRKIYTKNKKSSSTKSQLIFVMNQEGYRYQFNGYRKQDLKLMQKANLFLLLTFGYYVTDFIFSNPDKNFELFYLPIMVLIGMVFYFKNMGLLIRTLFIVFAIIIYIA